MKNIGINFKFNKCDSFDENILIKFIRDYNLYSNVIQIKFDLANIYIKKIIEIIENNFSGEIYIHIRNNNFLALNDFSEFFRYGLDKKFIVHIDSNFKHENCLKKIEKFKSFTKNMTIFFENGDDCNFSVVINELNLLFKYQHVKNFKFCLDLSHLFRGIAIYEQNKVISDIIGNKSILDNIGLFHLHGYNEIRDHLSLRNSGDKLIDYNAVKRLISLNDSPIILEVSLNNYMEYVDEIRYFMFMINN